MVGYEEAGPHLGPEQCCLQLSLWTCKYDPTSGQGVQQANFSSDHGSPIWLKQHRGGSGYARQHQKDLFIYETHSWALDQSGVVCLC